MADRTLRGSRLGAISYETEYGAEPAPRNVAAYRCQRGHEFSVPFSEEAEIPTTWECRLDGTTGLLDRRPRAGGQEGQAGTYPLGHADGAAHRSPTSKRCSPSAWTCCAPVAGRRAPERCTTIYARSPRRRPDPSGRLSLRRPTRSAAAARPRTCSPRCSQPHCGDPDERLARRWRRSSCDSPALALDEGDRHLDDPEPGPPAPARPGRPGSSSPARRPRPVEAFAAHRAR